MPLVSIGLEARIEYRFALNHLPTHSHLNNLIMLTSTTNPCTQCSDEKRSFDVLEILQKTNSSLKATVFISCLNGQAVVIKDYSKSQPFLRATACQIMIRREINAVKRAQGTAGVPKYLGTYGRYGFAMELIDGCELNKSMLDQEPQLLVQLDERIRALHDSGVTHNDIRMRNLLVDSKGMLFIIDFSGAVLRSHRYYSPSNLIYQTARFSDRVKVARLKQKFSKSPLSERDRLLARYAKLFKFISHCWKTYFYSWLKTK